MLTLENLILIAGLVQLSILFAAALTPMALDWGKQLVGLHPFVRKMHHVYGAFIFYIVAAFGVLSITNAEALAEGTRLGRSVAGLIALFWTARLCVQLFVFRFPDFIHSRFLKVGYHLMAPAFAYLAAVYIAAAAGA